MQGKDTVSSKVQKLPLTEISSDHQTRGRTEKERATWRGISYINIRGLWHIPLEKNPYKRKTVFLSKSHPPSEFIKRTWVGLFCLVKGDHIMTVGLKRVRKHIHNNSLLLKYTHPHAHKTTKSQHIHLSVLFFLGKRISRPYYQNYFCNIFCVDTYLTASPVTVTKSE